MVLEKTLERPLDCKEIQPVHSEGNQPWDFFGKNDAKAETPVLWPPHAKSWLIGKDPDAGRDWGQEEKGTTRDEMAGWHHGLDGREFEWTPGVGDGQGGLAWCSSWGHKESDTTERLNWTKLDLNFGCIRFPSVFLLTGVYLNRPWTLFCRGERGNIEESWSRSYLLIQLTTQQICSSNHLQGYRPCFKCLHLGATCFPGQLEDRVYARRDSQCQG